jgi:hypothetical protein
LTALGRLILATWPSSKTSWPSPANAVVPTGGGASKPEFGRKESKVEPIEGQPLFDEWAKIAATVDILQKSPNLRAWMKNWILVTPSR